MSINPRILIISHENDPHIPYITRHLALEPVEFNPARILLGDDLSYTIDGKKVSIQYQSDELTNVAAVWYRKPQDFDRDRLNVRTGAKHYAHSALQEHWHILRSSFENAYWLSDYYQIKRAENKVQQLALAARVGLKTPRTLMTSSSQKARIFIEAHGEVIVKSLARYSTYGEDGLPKAFFATKLRASDVGILSGLHLAPAIFQEAVDPDLDIRVHVIGDKVIASSIKPIDAEDTMQSVRDWKIAHYKGSMQIEPYTLPKRVSNACIKHTKLLGLEFGVIDLIRDRSGVYWFLENNPNGQWAFIEAETGQPIGAAIARLITQRVRH